MDPFTPAPHARADATLDRAAPDSLSGTGQPPVRRRVRPAAASAPAGQAAVAWPERLALDVVYRPTGQLKPAERQARTHSHKQLQQIAASIRQFGFVNPILIDAEGHVVAGHGRLAAAKQLGIAEVPCLCLAHMSDAQIRAYRLADNRLAELAGWDEELLALELGELLELELDFEIEVTGFDFAEIDRVMTAAPRAQGATMEDDDVPEPDAVAVSRPGELWLLGRHCLLCGDARDPAVLRMLLDGALAQMVFTDPPYNVPIAGHVSGLGKVRHREFAMACGEMSEAEFTGFLRTLFGNLAAATVDGAIHYVCIDWRHIYEVLTAGRVAYTELKNVCVWNKDNGGMGTFYRSKHELVCVFKSGTAAHINNFGLGENGRYRTNVWDYAGVNSFRRGRADELAMHPTVKPTALVIDAIRDCSKRGGIVLDPFGGSGTTLIAAHRSGRRGYLVEIDPLYVDVAIRRWQGLSGEPARLAGTDLTFDQAAAQRAADGASNDRAEAGEAGHD